MKRTGPTKESTKETILKLEKYGKANKQNIWLVLAKQLAKSTRERTKVNLWKFTNQKDKLSGKIVVIPGKVLGDGMIDFPVNVAALSFSEKAKQKIADNKGKTLTLKDLMEMKPKASELMIMK